MERIKDFFGVLISGLIIVAGTLFALFLFYMLFVVTPVAFHAESQCLAQGYPKAITDYKLNSYCTTLEGSVSVPVKKIN